MPFRITQESIISVRAEAIAELTVPGGVDSLAESCMRNMSAGERGLLKFRMKAGLGSRGNITVIPGRSHGAKYMFLAECPVWEDGEHGEEAALSRCFGDLLSTAAGKRCGSIAISLPEEERFGFPGEKAFGAALREIRTFLYKNDTEVILVVPGRESVVFPKGLEEEIEDYAGLSEREESAAEECDPGSYGSSYADASYGPPEPQMNFTVGSPSEASRPGRDSKPKVNYGAQHYMSSSGRAESDRYLRDLIDNAGETFQECLLHKIDERGLKDPDVYKRANLDRKHFSKIRNNANYSPTKKTALALSISLELSLEETQDLLERAGLALSPSSKADLIVKYCIIHRIYDIFEIDALLFKYGQQPLCS